MGYFSAGIIVSSKPNWETLNALPETIGLRGYAHKEHPFWLLEFWGGKLTPTYPFTQGHELVPMDSLPADESISLLENIEKCESTNAVTGVSWMTLGYAVARLLNTHAIVFAGDDEFYDFACIATPNGIERAQMRWDCSSISCTISKAQAIIRQTFEYEEIRDDTAEEGDHAWLENLKEIEGVTLDEPLISDEPFMFFGNTIELWPFANVTPDQIVGIGTWDVFHTLATETTLEFHRDGKFPE